MSIVPKPTLMKCDTGEINCFICTGRENCAEHAESMARMRDKESMKFNYYLPYIDKKTVDEVVNKFLNNERLNNPKVDSDIYLSGKWNKKDLENG